MDNQGRDLDVQDEVGEKAVDAKAKTSLQSPSGTREIDSRCPKGYMPSVKKDKENTNWEHWNRVKDKTKSHNLFFANSQAQTQASKKDKRHKNCQGGDPAIRVNTTKVVKKNKDKAKD